MGACTGTTKQKCCRQDSCKTQDKNIQSRCQALYDIYLSLTKYLDLVGDVKLYSKYIKERLNELFSARGAMLLLLLQIIVNGELDGFSKANKSWLSNFELQLKNTATVIKSLYLEPEFVQTFPILRYKFLLVSQSYEAYSDNFALNPAQVNDNTAEEKSIVRNNVSITKTQGTNSL